MTVGEIRAYIDETGDRGAGPNSSPIFGMTAVLADSQGQIALREAINKLRSDFSVPQDKVMSWKEHVKNHDRRKRAVEVLSQVQGIRIVYAYSQKSELREGSYRDDKALFYNFVAYQLYKSVLWAARSWAGPDAKVWTRYSHVKGHDHRGTESYIRREAKKDSRVPDFIEMGLKWVSADTYAELQAADIFSGFLKAALWPSKDFGYTEPSYLRSVWALMNHSHSCVIPLGIFPMPKYEVLTGLEWFPCPDCPKKIGSSGASKV